jgi:hypothetical protein
MATSESGASLPSHPVHVGHFLREGSMENGIPQAWPPGLGVIQQVGDIQEHR